MTQTAGTHDVTSALRPHFGTAQLGHGLSTSLELFYLHKNFSWDDWELASFLLVQVRSSLTEVLAIARLTVEEYGEGQTHEDAVLDLLRSLGDYRRSLEVREDRLASEGREDLKILRQLMHPKSNNS